MKIIILFTLILPITTYAGCDNLISYLNKEHPNRIHTQAYGYSIDKLVIFENNNKAPGSSLSVVECINGKYKTISTFKIKAKTIANLEFDEIAGTVIVILSVDPPKTGYIEKKNGKYVFTHGLYER